MRLVHIGLFCLFLIIIIVVICSVQLHSHNSGKLSLEDDGNNSTTAEPEKLYLKHMKISLHEGCSNKDISISQSMDSTSGIPHFIVQIVNTCLSGSCPPSRIHLHCGWFASTKIVNPTTFKRISYDDCLFNGGKALKPYQIVSFTYSNSFMYPIAFKSANFC